MDGEIIALRSEMHDQFQRARSLAASIDSYCTDNRDAPQIPPCTGVATERVRLERLSVVVQAEFNATAAAYREASVDVPPGRRLIESIVRR